MADTPTAQGVSLTGTKTREELFRSSRLFILGGVLLGPKNPTKIACRFSSI